MILPCRIHRIRSQCLWPETQTGLSAPLVAVLFAAFLLSSTSEAVRRRAVEEAGIGWLPAFEITSGVDFGYDDHVIGSNAAANSNSPSSFFAKENLVLTYNRPGEQTEVRLLAVGRFTQYFDVSTDDKDVNLTASLTHNFTTRLSFYASVYGAYQTEPDFQSNIGPTNVRAPHFDTNDIFSLTYHWLPRLSSVTSYTFERVKYESSSLSTYGESE